MHWIERFDLFLFDFDGLLVDTERLHFQAYQTLCLRHGYELAWGFDEYIGVAHTSATALRQALQHHLQDIPWEDLYQEKKEIYLDLLKQGHITLMPGVEILLKKLASRKIKRCVVTHSPKDQVDRIKSQFQILNTIPLWITREDYQNPKPAPDGYLKAIELLADPEDRIIGFEDSLRGLQALQKTRAHPVLICDSYHFQLQGDSLGVTHYSSLTKIPGSFILT